MQTKIQRWIVPAVIALHLALAVPAAYFLNIWVDEASSLYATQHGFWAAFQNAAVEQKQAPLYFWILSLWRLIDGSIFFAQMFSIICSIIAIKVFADLTSRILSPGTTWPLAVFFGLHPYLLWTSLEIRVYSLAILVSVVLIRLFFDNFWDRDREESVRQGPKLGSLWFLSVATVSLYTNYYLGFLLAGLFISLLVTGRWQEARKFFLLSIAMAIAITPLSFTIVQELQTKAGSYQEERSLVEIIRILWHHFLTFVFPTEIMPGPDQSWVSFARLWIMRIAAPLVAALVVWKRKHISERTVLLAAITGVVALCLIAAYFLIGSLFVHVRHAFVLFVPLVLLLGSVAEDLIRGSKADRPWVPMFAVLIFLPIFAYSAGVLYPNMTKRGDWARVATFIQENELPGQPIVTFEAFDALALPYYYSGVNPIYPDENFFDFGLQGPSGSAESMVRQNEFVISEIPPDTKQMWLVVNELCISTEACRPLEKFVKANYTIELEKEFYLSKVYLLKAKNQ